MRLHLPWTCWPPCDKRLAGAKRESHLSPLALQHRVFSRSLPSTPSSRPPLRSSPINLIHPGHFSLSLALSNHHPHPDQAAHCCVSFLQTKPFSSSQPPSSPQLYLKIVWTLLLPLPAQPSFPRFFLPSPPPSSGLIFAPSPLFKSTAFHSVFPLSFLNSILHPRSFPRPFGRLLTLAYITRTDTVKAWTKEPLRQHKIRER
jgi:hypothetical protein